MGCSVLDAHRQAKLPIQCVTRLTCMGLRTLHTHLTVVFVLEVYRFLSKVCQNAKQFTSMGLCKLGSVRRR